MTFSVRQAHHTGQRKGGAARYSHDNAAHRRVPFRICNLTYNLKRVSGYLTNHCDSKGRDCRRRPDGTTLEFAYTLDAVGRVEQVDLTNPGGTGDL